MKITFKMFPDIKETMIFEPLFDPETQDTLEEKIEKMRDSIHGVMYLDGKLAGEWYGYLLCNVPKVEEPYCPGDDFPEFGTRNYDPHEVFYMYSNGILETFQKKGYGRIMKAFALGYLKGQGCKIIIGHSHEEGSLQLNEEFGAEKIYCFKNWYETERKYWLYEIKL